MPSSAENRAGTRRGFWLSIARIFVVEILILLLLAAAALAYVNWSSEIAFAEFLAASKLAVSAPGPRSRPSRSSCVASAASKVHTGRPEMIAYGLF